MKTEPDAGRKHRNIGLVVFMDYLCGIRYSKYSVYPLCPETKTIIRGKLLSYPLYFNILRNGELCRQHPECYPNSLWVMVWDIYHTLLRKT
jgi:hypothetical protein